LANTFLLSYSARAVPRPDSHRRGLAAAPCRRRRWQRVAAAVLGLTLAGAGGSAARAQLPESRDPARLRAGVLLYAAPSIGDSRFAQTVVLLLEHGRNGSMGVVINQPSDTPLQKVLPSVPEARRLEVPVYWGGPVQPEGVTVLLRSPLRVEGARMILPDVYLTTQLEALRSALDDRRPDREIRVYAGYAGWSPGQLEREVRLGAWFLDRADAEFVFTLDPDSLWERVRSIMRRQQAWLAWPAAGVGMRRALTS